MKTILFYLCVICLFVSSCFFFSCEELATNSADDGSEPPVVSTGGVKIIDSNFVCDGTIESDGGADITECGICWSLIQPAKISDNKIQSNSKMGTFECQLDGLLAGNQYYIRAYATNKKGTSYGWSIAYTPPTFGTVTDIDGNIYKTVKIGNQWWMAENLQVTHYQNGDDIPFVMDNHEWQFDHDEEGIRCTYSNSTDNGVIFGFLYNYYAVIDSRKIAPAGWHIPTEGEWNVMIAALGGERVAGGKMKEPDERYWQGSQADATNISGFSALPAGRRNYNGSFNQMGEIARFWCTRSTRYFTLDYHSEDIGAYFGYNQDGYAVRCVKD